MRKNLREQQLTTAILQKKQLLNWGIFASLILAMMLISTSSYATCQNVNDGGEIGSDQTICSGSTVTITNIDYPSGGSGTLQYLWLANVDGPSTSGASTFYTTDASITTGALTETIWYRRCSRRNGCSSWEYGESNWIKITVNNAEFEHVDFENETACDANDGKIITDPYINQGTTLPYTVTYTYNGQSYTAGPYTQNQDNYITGLAPGVYSNITMTDANGCTDTHTDITIQEYTNCLPTDCDDVLVNWDLDACQAYSGAYSYDEFTPTITSNSDCGNITATTVYRDNPNSYYHSCLVGEEGNAMCISGTHVNYVPSSSVHKLKFSTTLNEGTTISGLSFFQKSEEYILNIGQSNSSLNNYLKKFSVRAKINGTIVFESNNNSTSQNDWEEALFDFSSVSEFELTGTTTIDFELVAYDPIGNGASMRAWEIDEIKILGCCASGASIGDFVFNDIDGDGIQDGNEPGIDGVTVMLLDDNGNMVDQTSTNADGFYSFTGVDAGEYKLKFPASGTASGLTYILTQDNEGSNDDEDSDPIVVNGTNNAETAVFTVAQGDEITNMDAGYFIASKITGVAFHDSDSDGIQETGDARLGNITVMLLDDNGNMVDQTTTNELGVYEFDGLAPGSYKVKVAQNVTSDNKGYVLTYSNQGTDDDIDSDPVRMNDNSGNAMSGLVYVQNGATVDNIDAGYILTASIGDRVFEDKNANGLQDFMDENLANAQITLFGNDIFGNSVNAATSSNANGEYGFNNLAPGTYYLIFSSPSGELIPTTKDALGNGFDNDDSDIDENSGRTDILTLSPGDNNKTIDAGFKFDPSLPVELTSFEAILVNNNQVVLKWSTASEENNKHFIVERSLDGREFEPIGVVTGNGTTSLVNHYTLDDLDPFYGHNYYRLKQVDFDGKFEFSHVETVIIEGDDLPELILYPNPVQTRTTLRVAKPFESDTTIEIISTSGNVVKTIIMERGANSKQIDLGGYPSGMYFAYINFNGHRTLVYNIVKVDE